jgi:hypothetical protein
MGIKKFHPPSHKNSSFFSIESNLQSVKLTVFNLNKGTCPNQILLGPGNFSSPRSGRIPRKSVRVRHRIITHTHNPHVLSGTGSNRRLRICLSIITSCHLFEARDRIYSQSLVNGTRTASYTIVTLILVRARALFLLKFTHLGSDLLSHHHFKYFHNSGGDTFFLFLLPSGTPGIPLHQSPKLSITIANDGSTARSAELRDACWW